MRLPPAALLPDFAACNQFLQRFGTSYAFATKLFPPAQQYATQALYAFFRVPDEIVDWATDTASAQAELDRFGETWRTGNAWNKDAEEYLPIIRAARWVFQEACIPEQYAVDFLAAMQQDLTVSRYKTYADLERYMYGSAAVVGLMMTHVIGFQSPQALDYARSLGEAMQLTNFLRDVWEDYDVRERIYLPQEDMKRFGVTEAMLEARRMTPALQELMAFEAERAHALYRKAEPGIALLAPEGRRAVRLASRLYEAILGRLAARRYDIFRGRARTSSLQKLWILFTTR